MWEVFFTPHTDDESIGMAGAIVRARSLGHKVLVVLVTDNLPSIRGTRLFSTCNNVAMARRDEWRYAMEALNVTRLDEWNLPEVDMLITPFVVQADIERRMRNVHDEYRAVHYHTVWGVHDIAHESGNGHLSHGLCANALFRFAAARPEVRATLYGVYVYSQPAVDRHAPCIHQLTANEFSAKKRALEFYKETEKTIGYGYRSVPELIDNAMADPREFTWEVNHAVSR